MIGHTIDSDVGSVNLPAPEQPAGGGASSAPSFADAVGDLAASSRLNARRLVMLPLSGPGAVFTDVQGRRQGEAFAPAALADLISSIGAIGLLHPVLVEDLDADAHPGDEEDSRGRRHRLVTGERRLRAMRWGATAWPDHPHFSMLPALVCPGPLSEFDRRRWQLAENLAREELRPGDLGAALLLERSALVASRLAGAGVDVEVAMRIDDPADRFAALEDLRAGRPDCAAPWSEVLTRLAIQMSPRKARAVAAAFRELPRDLSSEMDAHEIALTTRSALVQAANGRPDVAAELWHAVAERGRVDLLAAASTAKSHNPGLSGEQAVDEAERAHQDANAARGAALAAAAQSPRAPVAGPSETAVGSVDRELLHAVLVSLRSLADQIRAGRHLDEHDAGSLRLLLEQITGQVRDQQ